MGRCPCRYQGYRAVDAAVFRIMVLREPDVLPLGDFGLERAVETCTGRPQCRISRRDVAPLPIRRMLVPVEDSRERAARVRPMPNRFYLSTRKDRATQASVLLEALKVNGWERTLDWTTEEIVGPEGYAHTALAEIAAVRDADVLLVLLPGGYGTHVEIGAALALGKPVILHAPDRETLDTPYPCIFHYHPGVKLLVSDVLDVGEVLANMPD